MSDTLDTAISAAMGYEPVRSPLTQQNSKKKERRATLLAEISDNKRRFFTKRGDGVTNAASEMVRRLVPEAWPPDPEDSEWWTSECRPSTKLEGVLKGHLEMLRDCLENSDSAPAAAGPATQENVNLDVLSNLPDTSAPATPALTAGNETHPSRTATDSTDPMANLPELS